MEIITLLQNYLFLKETISNLKIIIITFRFSGSYRESNEFFPTNMNTVGKVEKNSGVGHKFRETSIGSLKTYKNEEQQCIHESIIFDFQCF